MSAITCQIDDNPEPSMENLLELLNQGARAIQAAAKMLAQLAHADPGFLDKLRERAPAFPPAFLANLLRVGEGSLHPQLLFNSAPAYGRLRALPYTVQEQAINAGAVEVVLNAETGEALRVPLTEMRAEHVHQVFGPSGIRSADEQRAALRRKVLAAQKPAARTELFPWTVRKDRVVITKAVELTRKDLLRMLEEIA